MTSPPAKKRRIGPHSRAFKDGSLGLSVDGRSSEGRYLRRVIAELTAQLGREPTFAEGLLIRRAARASLILDLFDSKIMAGESWTQVDANTMGGVAGSLMLILRELGVKPHLPEGLNTSEIVGFLGYSQQMAGGPGFEPRFTESESRLSR